MHILDLIVYFVLVFILIKVINYSSDGKFLRGELDGESLLIICAAIFIYTLVYAILFIGLDLNWVDLKQMEWPELKW